MSARKSLASLRLPLRKILAFGICSLLFLSILGAALADKTAPESVGPKSPVTTVVADAWANDGIWQKMEESSIANRQPRASMPGSYLTLRLNQDELRRALGKAPMQGTGALRHSPALMALPMPDGSFARFRVEESPVMEAALAAKFPEIKTYRGQGLDDPTATTRFDVTPNGLHAIVLSAHETVYIEPYARGNTRDYIVFYQRDAPADSFRFECLSGGNNIAEASAPGVFAQRGDAVAAVNGEVLRTYRLAIGATAEYTAVYGGGTVAGALAAIASMINTVNAIYERELAMRFVLIAEEIQIIFTDTMTDGYTHDNIPTLPFENQVVLDTIIEPTKYDIGQVFDARPPGSGVWSTGLASFGGGCRNGQKGTGAAIFRDQPVPDLRHLQVIHEFGHQLGARHTHNSTLLNCLAARNASSAYEPASGSTIMGLAWNCSTQDLGINDTYFHTKSLLEIAANNLIVENMCGVPPAATDNQPPVITAGDNYTIPRSTPFALTATGSDPDGDALTYTWEQYNLGPPSPPDTDADGQARPILRSYRGTTNPTRTFPSLQYILNNANNPPTQGACPPASPRVGLCALGESLPTMTRTMIFHVTARDNRTVGAVNSDDMFLNIDGNSGPFNITAPNTQVRWIANSAKTVTWNVANTDNAPVNAAFVRILLSTDGGNTFPLVLNPSTPNDGSEAIVVPNTSSPTARIKIEAVGNVFFDISDTNFTINAAPVPSRADVLDFDGDNRTDAAVIRDSGGTLNWYLQQSLAGFAAQPWGITGDRAVPADYDGDGKWDIAIWRPGSTAHFYILKSLTGTFETVAFGTTGDDPRITQDFDGDGKADPAVTRNVGGALSWYIQRSSLGFTGVMFGNGDDSSIRGDFDGDGKADIGVYRNGAGAAANTFFIVRSSDGTVLGQNFGNSNTDYGVPADFDGDGKTDFAVYRFSGPEAGNWYWLRSSDGAFAALSFGTVGDLPVPGDYDGDGRTDQAVWRPGSPSVFYLNRSSNGFASLLFGNLEDTVPSYTLQAR